ncbi:MAG: hypothetical protein CME98_15700 [Hyphomonas sp.]|nr:hypothetical protein [Hyphomonas sp.]
MYIKIKTINGLCVWVTSLLLLTKAMVLFIKGVRLIIGDQFLISQKIVGIINYLFIMWTQTVLIKILKKNYN